MDVKREFSRWFERKFVEWQNSTGKRKTIDEFAKWLGFKQPIVSLWMSGDRSPSQYSADRIALKLGDEVYTLLGLQPSDMRLVGIEVNWDRLTDSQRTDLHQLADRFVRENAADYVADEEPENRVDKTD